MGAFLPSKPLHNRYLLQNLTETSYASTIKQYSRAKAGGIRCVYAWASGQGLLGVVKEVGKGVVIDYGKRKLAAGVITASGYVLGPAIIVFTNATKIVKGAKAVHGAAAYIIECAEDSTNLAFLPLDVVLFGQPVPIGASERFNFFNSSDFFELVE